MRSCSSCAIAPRPSTANETSPSGPWTDVPEFKCCHEISINGMPDELVCENACLARASAAGLLRNASSSSNISPHANFLQSLHDALQARPGEPLQLSAQQRKSSPSGCDPSDATIKPDRPRQQRFASQAVCNCFATGRSGPPTVRIQVFAFLPSGSPVRRCHINRVQDSSNRRHVGPERGVVMGFSFNKARHLSPAVQLRNPVILHSTLRRVASPYEKYDSLT